LTKAVLILRDAGFAAGKDPFFSKAGVGGRLTLPQGMCPSWTAAHGHLSPTSSLPGSSPCFHIIFVSVLTRQLSELSPQFHHESQPNSIEPSIFCLAWI